jgi:exodeoxyribonuclease VII small subunit
VSLTRECQSALAAAQARVEVLLKRDGEAQLVPFEAEEDKENEE